MLRINDIRNNNTRRINNERGTCPKLVNRGGVAVPCGRTVIKVRVEETEIGPIPVLPFMGCHGHEDVLFQELEVFRVEGVFGFMPLSVQCELRIGALLGIGYIPKTH
jgi:hypothetical protein